MDNIKVEILEYFEPSGFLKSLDGEKEFYTGVTLPYVYKYVLEERYPFDYVARTLKDMVENHELRMLYCTDVNTMVFESNNNSFNHYSYFRGGYSIPTPRYYNFWNNILKEEIKT